jgi:hypothetical protein
MAEEQASSAIAREKEQKPTPPLRASRPCQRIDLRLALSPLVIKTKKDLQP